MSSQSSDDIQILIDKLFEKLDKATSGGELTQCTHALRVQITKKAQMGASLHDREKRIIASLGEISAPKKTNTLLILALVSALAIAAYIAFKIL